jgi:hypothetical protein
MRSRLWFSVILFAILLTSCGARPGVTVSMAGQVVPTVLASTSEGTACSTYIGDAFPRNLPLTTVRTPTPMTLHFEAGQGATEIRGWIYDDDAPTPSGRPIEEFNCRVGVAPSSRGRSSPPAMSTFVTLIAGLRQ